MIPFLYAKELKKQYTVYGSFYNVINGDDLLEFRNLLEIYSKPYFKASKFTNYISSLEPNAQVQPLPDVQHQGVPDAIFIMMNPGSSRPIEKNYIIPAFLNDGQLLQKIIKNPMILAQPDNAQYQIMNIMAYKNWRHVRILNLSDIRDAKSPSFMKNVGSLLDIPHSIFDSRRSKELLSAITSETIPVYAAWGRDTKLISLATQCLSALPLTHQPKGVHYPEDDDCLYAYASPPLKKFKLQWLQNMETIL